MEIKESVTPSGVKFSVRNLIGKDQDLLTKQMNKGESGAFNEMLANALQSLGDLEKHRITPKVASELLSNDRKFILLTLRNHTLDYQKIFAFKYEFALRQGHQSKEVFDYEVELTHENFPVKPYWWMRDAIQKAADNALKLNEEYAIPDGHVISFPELYPSYQEMLNENKFVMLEKLPKSGLKLRWEILDGLIERQFAEVMKNDLRINLMIDMRKPKYSFMKEGKEQWIMFETGKQHVVDLEALRMDIQDKEGNVDTSLTIQHPDDPGRQQRVDLIALPVFFFPSLGR